MLSQPRRPLTGHPDDRRESAGPGIGIAGGDENVLAAFSRECLSGPAQPGTEQIEEGEEITLKFNIIPGHERIYAGRCIRSPQG